MKKIIFLCVALLLVNCFLVMGAELTILTEDLPPLNYLRDGQLVGPSVEIVQEIQKRVGSTDPIQVYPWARAYKIAIEKPNVVIFGTTQTEARKDLFHWIGTLAEKRDVLVAKKGSKQVINNLEDAKNVHRIGTLRGDTRERFLLEKGFTNLESVSDDKKNAQKLSLGRIDLWAYKIPGVETVCELANINAEEFEEVLHLRTIDVSIAMSKKTPEAIVQRWKTAYQEIRDDGTFDRIRSNWNLK